MPALQPSEPCEATRMHRVSVRPESAWIDEEKAHQWRVDRLTQAHFSRRERGQKHPVHDFLFDYYSIRRSRLMRWHPGIGVHLVGDSARKFLDRKGYVETPEGIAATTRGIPAERLASIRWIRSLLSACAIRRLQLACFGLHEWAMVYRSTERRHLAVPLRLSSEETDRVVESHPLCCSHFDAFRFFMPGARPLNQLQPEPETRLQHEQRGCLHVNMDLFKWAGKLQPWTPSSLLIDTLELAMRIREIDMRASPYDLAAWGFAPIPVETPLGRQEYEQHQRAFAEEAIPLRQALIDVCEKVLGTGSE